MLPPNLPALAPAAAVAIVTTMLARGDRGPWLDSLLRVVAGIAITMVFIGVAAIAEIATRAGELDSAAIFFRLGGMSVAAGIAVLCRVADRRHLGQTPTETLRRWRAHSPRSPVRKWFRHSSSYRTESPNSG